MPNLMKIIEVIINAIMIALNKRTVRAAEKEEDLEVPEPLPLEEEKPEQAQEPSEEKETNQDQGPSEEKPGQDQEPEEQPVEEDPRRVFKEALQLTLKYEGGYVNHPNDPGGATNKGVTQKVYDTYRKEHGLATKTVKEISDQEVEDIYYSKYWLKGRCDKLPDNLAIVHFDTSVHSGIRQSSKFVQRSVGANDDGMIGPKTLATVEKAVKTVGVPALLKDFLDQRRNFFKLIADRNPKLQVFMKGWMNRVASLENYVGAERIMYASSQSEESDQA